MKELLIKFILNIPLLVCHVEEGWEGAYGVVEDINNSCFEKVICFVSGEGSMSLIRCNEMYSAPAGVTDYRINYPIAFICGGYKEACLKNFSKWLKEDNPGVMIIEIKGLIY